MDFLFYKKNLKKKNFIERQQKSHGKWEIEKYFRLFHIRQVYYMNIMHSIKDKKGKNNNSLLFVQIYYTTLKSFPLLLYLPTTNNKKKSFNNMAYLFDLIDYPFV